MTINVKVMYKIDCSVVGRCVLKGHIIHYFNRVQNYSWERVIEAMTVVREKDYYRGTGARTCH